MTGLATSVTRMPRARSTPDFARGRCEAEDVERAVARAPPTIRRVRHVVERGKRVYSEFDRVA